MAFSLKKKGYLGCLGLIVIIFITTLVICKPDKKIPAGRKSLFLKRCVEKTGIRRVCFPERWEGIEIYVESDFYSRLEQSGTFRDFDIFAAEIANLYTEITRDTMPSILIYIYDVEVPLERYIACPAIYDKQIGRYR